MLSSTHHPVLGNPCAVHARAWAQGSRASWRGTCQVRCLTFILQGSLGALLLAGALSTVSWGQVVQEKVHSGWRLHGTPV